MKKIVLALFLIIIFSCKNKNSENKAIENINNDKPSSIDTETSKEEKTTASIVFYLKIKETDSVQLFYNDKKREFKEQNSFTKKVNGGWQTQTVTFNFKTDFIPVYLRFDFGTKKDQEIEIEKIVFKAKKDVLEISQDKVYTLFNPNDWVEILDPDFGKFKATVYKGRIDPKLITSNGTVQMIENLY